MICVGDFDNSGPSKSNKNKFKKKIKKQGWRGHQPFT
jgi:hypothetical protein